MKRFLLYLFRWQLSSPILAIFIIIIPDKIIGTIVANLVGGCIFYFVDRFIFTSRSLDPVWEVKSDVMCCDCGHMGRGYRVVKAGRYDRSKDRHPKYRCENCSDIKWKSLMENYI